MLFFTVWLRKKNRRDRKEERKFSLLGPLFLSSQNMRKMRREKCLEIHFTQIPSHLPLILFITWLFPLLILVTFFSQQSSNVLGSLSLSLSLSLWPCLISTTMFDYFPRWRMLPKWRNCCPQKFADHVWTSGSPLNIWLYYLLTTFFCAECSVNLLTTLQNLLPN